MKNFMTVALALATLSSSAFGADYGKLTGQVVLDGTAPALKPKVAKGDPAAKDPKTCAAQDVPNDEFVVNPVFSGTQTRTSGLTALASGDLVASWTDGSKVYGRLFETGGTPAPAAGDSYATDETRAVWGRLAHAGDQAGPFGHHVEPVVHHRRGRAGGAFLQVGAAAERFVAGAREDDDAHVIAEVKLRQQHRQLGAQLRVERVHRLGSIQGDDGDAVLDSARMDCAAARRTP